MHLNSPPLFTNKSRIIITLIAHPNVHFRSIASQKTSEKQDDFAPIAPRRISHEQPPSEDLVELRLSPCAMFSFSRRRLSRRSLTNRVNYGLPYQLARRLDGRVDVVGRVKIQAAPIRVSCGARLIEYRGTANEKITCLALSAGLRNRNRLGPAFRFIALACTGGRLTGAIHRESAHS